MVFKKLTMLAFAGAALAELPPIHIKVGSFPMHDIPPLDHELTSE
jgi:hypothetical protein